MERVKIEFFRLFCPGFADCFTWRPPLSSWLLAGKAIESLRLLTTTQEAPAAAKTPRQSKKQAIAPEELQKQRSLLLPIAGGLKADRQKDFAFGEPLITTPAKPKKRRP